MKNLNEISDCVCVCVRNKGSGDIYTILMGTIVEGIGKLYLRQLEQSDSEYIFMALFWCFDK